MANIYARDVVKGTALIFAMALATNVVSYLIRIFLARSLTPTEFGLVYASIAFISLLNIFRNFGMGQTMQKKVPEFLASRSYGKIKYAMKFSFSVQFAYAVFVLLIVVLFSEQIASSIFQTEQAIPLLIILAVFGLVHAANQVIISTLQGLRRIKLYTALEFFNYIFRFAFVVLLIPLGTLALPYSQLAATVVFTAAGFLAFTAKFPSIINAKSKNVSGELIAFSVPVMIGLVATTIVSNFDTVLLSSLRSLEEVALYQVALPLANTLLIFGGSVIIVLLPLVSELWTKKDRQAINKIVGLLAKALFALIVPITLILVTFPELVIGILFGEAYLPAADVLQLLSIAVTLQSVALIFSSVILAIGKPKITTKIVFFIAGINVVANLVLIPLLGITGAAVSLIFSSAAGITVLVYMTRKYVRFHFQTLNFFKIVFGGVLTAAIIFVLKAAIVANPWVELAIALTSGFVFYFVYIVRTRTISRAEMKLLFDSGLPVPKLLKSIALRIAV